LEKVTVVDGDFIDWISRTSRKGLAMPKVIKNILISPFSKELVKVMVLGMLVS
jgi:hypothetical protein